jgi:hypothetical protein
MALGSTQPLIEMRTRNPYGVEGGRRVRVTTLPPSVSRLSREIWEPRRLTTLWVSTVCYKDSFTFTFYFYLVVLNENRLLVLPRTSCFPDISERDDCENSFVISGLMLFQYVDLCISANTERYWRLVICHNTQALISPVARSSSMHISHQSSQNRFTV